MKTNQVEALLGTTIPNSLIIAGTRDTTEAEFALAIPTLDAMPRPSLVIHGAQRQVDRKTFEVLGADYWGAQWAKSRGIPVKPMPADWNRFGKKAGPIRNRQMAEIGESLFAVWDGRSSGTRNMIAEMTMGRGKKVDCFGIRQAFGGKLVIE